MLESTQLSAFTPLQTSYLTTSNIDWRAVTLGLSTDQIQALGERGYCEAFESAGGELASGASSNPSADDAHAILDCPVDRECRVDFPGVAC